MPYRTVNENGLYTPYFRILIGGKELAEAYYKLIDEVRYEDHESGSDTATIQITDPELKIMDDPSIIRGSRIKIEGGWKDRKGNADTEVWLAGYISLIDAAFPETGSPMLTINCMDESFLLDRDDDEGNYQKISFKTLVSTLLRKKKYKGMFSIGEGNYATSKVYDEISQTRESDLKLILRMAEEEGLGIKIRDGKIYWWKADAKYPVHSTYKELHWREAPFDLKSFSCRLALADKKPIIKTDKINNNKAEDSGTGTSNPQKDGTDKAVDENFTLDFDNKVWDK